MGGACLLVCQFSASIIKYAGTVNIVLLMLYDVTACDDVMDVL